MRSSAVGSGFVLLDTLIAVALLIAVAAGVVHLFAISVAEARLARERTMATVLAAGRLEQLRGLAWDYVPAPPGGPALPRSDWVTDLSADPPGVSGTGLMETPPGTLDTNTRGSVDYLDARGRWLGSGGSPPGSAAYIRRWAIRPLPANPADAVVLQVLVTPVAQERRRLSARRIWTGEDVLLTTVRARTAR
jgi:type II secretory pathway pseudopilin PulG